MFNWLRNAWEQSNAAFQALEDLQADNTLARLAAGRLRISEEKVNETLAATKMQGVRSVSLHAERNVFTLTAQSERFFLARISMPMRIEEVVFTRYRHRLILGVAGPISAFGATLWQSSAAYALIILLRHALHPHAILREAVDPAAGISFNGTSLEIDLHKSPEFRAALNWEYVVMGRKFHPLHFVTIESITPLPGCFEVRSSVNWDALYAALRDVTRDAP
jgi:hypothetical protein